MRYFAIFADTGERLMSLIADGMPYTVKDIMVKYPEAIEITEEQQALYMQGYVRGSDGLPHEPTDSTDVDTAKSNKIEEIKYMATRRLMETDHNILEYMELNKTDSAEYQTLKVQRQAIRDYRDNLINSVNQATTTEVVNNITWKI